MPRLADDELRSLMTRAMRHQQAGQPAEAEKILREILKQRPEVVDAQHFLGLSLHQQGRSEEGLRALQKSLQAQPRNPLYHNNAGIVLRAIGRLEDAAKHFRNATSLATNYAEAWFNLGLNRQDQGRLEESIEAYGVALSLRPDYTKALVNLAGVFRSAGCIDDAIDACERAIVLNPELIEPYQVLVGCLIETSQFTRATERLVSGISLLPDNADLQICLGEVQAAEGLLDEATLTCDRLMVSVTSASVCFRVGEIYRSLGNHSAAANAYRHALALRPSDAPSIFGLASLAKVTSEEREVIELAEAALAQRPTSDDALTRLHFALGKAYDDLGEFGKAFKHYEAGNGICREKITFDWVAYKDHVDRIIQAFSESLIRERTRNCWSDRRGLIFVVGMPRSGTTLVEQILASHPAVRSAGELLHITRLVRNINRLIGVQIPYPECMPAVTPEVGGKLAETYLSALPSLSGEQRFITDKMPNNYMHLGLIGSLFPKSKVIHCRRNPIDVCLSIFFQLFDKSHSYAFDLRDIGFCYREYERLMAHWRSVLGDRMHEVEYSALVDDQQVETARLLQFCDLPWEDACLKFHLTNRVVSTASRWQVRQPIYRSSLNRSRQYREFLEPLIEMFGDDYDLEG